jgi:hypothetical protein
VPGCTKPSGENVSVASCCDVVPVAVALPCLHSTRLFSCLESCVDESDATALGHGFLISGKSSLGSNRATGTRFSPPTYSMSVCLSHHLVRRAMEPKCYVVIASHCGSQESRGPELSNIPMSVAKPYIDRSSRLCTSMHSGNHHG